MKHISFSYLLLGFSLTLACGLANGQTPTSCAQPGGMVLPWQDCQGARWLTSQETLIQTLTVTGPGCTKNELPASTETCLITNERRTVWLMFEVQPLPGGLTYKGAPAGNLSFTIIPADAATEPSDNGRTMIGLTDYDFALFKVTDKNSRADACSAIAAAKHVGTEGTPQIACNYAGLAGPTGLDVVGTELAVDNQRYCKPVAVSVGDVFLLAVDNYSLNATYFRLVFGNGPMGLGSAQIAPSANNTAGTPSVRANKACGYGLEVNYPTSVSLDSVRTDAFALTYKGKTFSPTSITANNADVLRGQASRFTLMFGIKIDSGLVQLEQKGTLADRYGRQQGTFTVLKNVQPPVALLVSSTEICAGQGLKVSANAAQGFAYSGWRTTAGFGQGTGVLGAYGLPSGLPSTPGQHALTYLYTWPDGCPDSVSVQIRIKPRPAAPILTTDITGALETTLTPGASPQWQWQDSLFNAPAVFTPTAPGLYRVHQLLNGCASPWSKTVTIQTVTATKEAFSSAVMVAPNPATTTVSITLASAAMGSLATLTAADGRIVLSQNLSAEQNKLAVGHLSRGLYLLQVTTGKNSYQQRLLVQ